jgi:nucleotide-binding universal stress UspA family protein
LRSEVARTHGWLREVADRHGVDAKGIVCEPGDVAAALAEVAGRPKTLLCLRSHARNPVTELVLGSVSEQVVRTSTQPVLLVGPHCAPPPERYKSIVVGLDGSPLAERILPTVETWSTGLDVTPWLLQVLPGHVPLETEDDDVTEPAYVHDVAGRLTDRYVQPEWETVHHRDPATAIVRFAGDHAPALVALTTHGRSGLGRLALGGVAFRVTHRAHSPVLVLRPE